MVEKRESHTEFSAVAIYSALKIAQMKNLAPGASQRRGPYQIKTLIFFCFLMAGVEGLEPPAPGFGDRCSTS